MRNDPDCALGRCTPSGCYRRWVDKHRVTRVSEQEGLFQTDCNITLVTEFVNSFRAKSTPPLSTVAKLLWPKFQLCGNAATLALRNRLFPENFRGARSAIQAPGATVACNNVWSIHC